LTTYDEAVRDTWNVLGQMKTAFERAVINASTFQSKQASDNWSCREVFFESSELIVIA
jgi:hypothetical protein